VHQKSVCKLKKQSITTTKALSAAALIYFIALTLVK